MSWPPGIVHFNLGPGAHRTFQAAANDDFVFEFAADHHVVSHIPRRKFHLNRDLFDLIKKHRVLDLTDQRLLGWYLMLPPEDRRIIQGEGGLLQFLQKHPAFEVAKHSVHLKDLMTHVGPEGMSTNLNKSRRPTFYCVWHCLQCDISNTLDTKKCRRCNEPMAESAQTYLTETEHYMLPDSIQNQPNKEDMCASGDFRRAAEPVKLSQARNLPSSASLERSDAFHSACDSTAAEDIEETFCTRLVSAEKQTQHSLNLELLQETSVEASLSLDIELEMHQRNARSMQAGDCWDKGKADFEARGLREAETYSSVPGYQELEKETLPDYYSFNSTGFYEAERDASSGPPCMSSDTESGATADPLGDTPEEGCYKTSEKCSNAALEESKGCDSQCTSSLDDWPGGTSFSEYGYGSEGDPENDQNFEVYHSIAEGTSFTAEQDELQTESTRPAGLRCDHCLPVPDGTKSSADKDANNNDNNSLLEVDSSIDCLGWDVPEKPCGFKCEPPVARDDTSLYEESFLSAAAANSLLPEPSIEMDISGYVGASAFERSGQYRESDAEESPTTTCQRCLAASDSTIRVNQIIDASADFRAGFTSTTATEASVFVASKSTSTDNPGVPHAHAAVNTEWSLLQGALRDGGSQTSVPSTSEKCINTDLRMVDLDSFAEEFMKLRLGKEELNELKKKLARMEKCSAAACGCSCDTATQRAVKAELQLLDLHYWMCRQHCWRLHYTVHEKGFSDLGAAAHSQGLESALQELQSDYSKMREKILSGTSLDDLPPLSVDSKRIVTLKQYVPSKVMAVALSSQEVVCSHQEKGLPEDKNNGRGVPSSSQVLPFQEKPHFEVSTRCCKSVHDPANRGSDCKKQRMKKDHDFTEDWFDAEENLRTDGQIDDVLDNTGVTRQTAGGICGSKSTEAVNEDWGLKCENSAEREKQPDHYLCVRDLSVTVTEKDLMRLFQKYQATDVWITNTANHLRLAIVTVCGTSCAEKARKEMNGKQIHGRAIKVDPIRQPGVGWQNASKHCSYTPAPVQEWRAESCDGKQLRVSSQTGPLIHQTGPVAPPKVFKRNYEKLQCVQDTPTASGTFLTQHYAGLSSFDKLMDRLMKLHPEAGRQKIVEALIELRAEKKGFLSGLPLKTIVEMTSAVLKKNLTGVATQTVLQRIKEPVDVQLIHLLFS
ncbi:RNA-binding protein 44 isoform X2 [Acipenser ruthenus]|nr:RNA-binding protein 44 isoform X2 [Acipenser ruthenus]